MSNEQIGPSNRGGSQLFYRLFSKGPETPNKGKWVSKFYAIEKNNGGWEPNLEKGYDSFSLLIKGVEHKTFKSEQHGTKHSLKIMGTTDLGDVSIEMNFSAQTYGIINALCNKTIDRTKPTRIEVWTTASKEKADVYYANAKVCDLVGNKYEWAFTKEKTPKAEQVQFAGKIVTDDSKVVNFWIKAIQHLKNEYAAIFGASPAPSAPAKQEPEQQEKPKTAMQPNQAFSVSPELKNNPSNEPPADFFSDVPEGEDDLPF